MRPRSVEPSADLVEVLVSVALSVFLLACHGLFFISAGGLWRDETNSVQIATMDRLSDIWPELEHDSFPLPWFLFLRAWHAAGLGSADQSWRVIGLLVGLTLVCVLWLSGRLLHEDGRWRLPLVATFLIAMCPVTLQVGDSLRAYGTGMILLIWAIVATWRYTTAPSRPRWGIMSIAFLTAVQILFYNAIGVFALGMASAVMGARRRSWKAALAPLVAGAISAASLIVYGDMFQRMAGWNFLVKTDMSMPLLFHSLNSALHHFAAGSVNASAPLIPLLPTFAPLAIYVTAVLCAIAACVVDARGGSARHCISRQVTTPPASPETTSLQDRAWFCGVALSIYVPLYLLVLWKLSYVLHPRYFLGLIAFTGILVDMALDTRLSATQRRVLLRASGVAILSLMAATAMVRVAMCRQTNVDLASRFLEANTKPSDLILISPWYLGVSFDYHFRGTSRWMTMPVMGDLSIHRYDEYVANARDPNRNNEIPAAIAKTYREGGDVWYVGSELAVDSTTNPQQNTLSGSGYGLAVAAMLLEKKVSVDVVPPLASQPVQEFEDVHIFRFRK
jgi:hypothetical protein